MKLKQHTLYFPGSWLESILAWPTDSCWRTVFPIALSERLDVYTAFPDFWWAGLRCEGRLLRWRWGWPYHFAPLLARKGSLIYMPWISFWPKWSVHPASSRAWTSMAHFGASMGCHQRSSLVGGGSGLQARVLCPLSAQDDFKGCNEQNGATHCDYQFHLLPDGSRIL